MKLLKSTIVLTTVALAAGLGSAIAQTATPGLIPAGSCSLPQGKYVLTNLNTGSALYVEIDGAGKLMAQDPKALRFEVASGTTTTTSATAPATTTTGTQTQAPTPSKGGFLNTILQHGVNSLMTPNQAPAN